MSHGVFRTERVKGLVSSIGYCYHTWHNYITFTQVCKIMSIKV